VKRSEIDIGIDGEKWIIMNRPKTGTSTIIPLLPLSLQNIERYKEHPQCIRKDRVLPVLGNQKMNSYLKEIVDVCRIQRPLTFHLARHPFATTITLSNGVSIETVSQMLDHKSLRTTQIYAKIQDFKVSEDMKMLRMKLSPVKNKNMEGTN